MMAARSSAPTPGEERSAPATLGARVAADLLHQGARNLIIATRK
ncbi:hypothetical protein [Streptosporangium sp. H16]